MPITLTPEQEELVKQKVASGQFASANDVLDVALRLFQAQYHEDPLSLEELRHEISIGLDQEARGEYGPLDVEAIIAAGHKRLAEKRERQ
jgi:putative addiction module CopG family antidote